MRSFGHGKRLQPLDAQNVRPQSFWTAKLCATLLLGLALVAPAVSFATDLTAEQIVAKVSQTYSALSSFRFVERQESREATDADPSVMYAVPDPFGNGPAQGETDLAVSTPGMIRLVVSSGEGGILLVSDGRKTWAYIPNLNEYTETDAAPLLQELWAHPVRLIGNDLARYRGLSREAGRAKLRGEETVSLGGQEVRCYVVGVPDRSGSRRLWVDEQRFIVLRDEWISTPGTGADNANPYRSELLDAGVSTSRLTKADLGPISNDAFQFDVPSGARRVDSFSPPAGPLQRGEEVLLGRLMGSEMEHVVQGTEYVLQGSKARDFTVASLGGENVRLHGLHNKIVVLDFWASWCMPCQGELAAIQKLHDELASKGVVFLGIDEERSETVEDFVKAHGYTFPMLLDSKQTVHGLYGVRCVPRTVVINRKGKIAAEYIGAGGEEQLRRALKSAGLNTTP
jgi:peroxiredoxin/outer membrane lipoprotein-sorting protein